ncbi:MAG: glutamyl-tRNA reductase [Vampirovibrio sp.]|nr:glutamyl-tRNA reductase [Vampirovibrio sp.]
MRHILVTGVRQSKAPIEVREKFALTEPEVTNAIDWMMAQPGVEECVVLTTCNRTEIYLAGCDAATCLKTVKRFFRDVKGVDVDRYRRAMFTLMGEDTSLHLFRVASGLDSLILGEAQILGQVKEALAAAQQKHSAGARLDKLFKTALTVGKRVRTETGIAVKDVSVSRAAYQLMRRESPDLLEKRIALLGGGKMASILLASLKRDMTSEQLARVMVVNRSEKRLAELVEKFGITQTKTWADIDNVLADADVLFVATGAPHLVLEHQDFVNAGPCLVMDISVPRNVDPAVENLDHVRLYNTDDLKALGASCDENVQVLTDHAREIIEEEFAGYCQWLISRPVAPTIAQLRSKIEQIATLHAASNLPVKESNGSMPDTEAFVRSLVNKILHDPTMRLKTTQNLEEIYRQAATLSHLFNIETPMPWKNVPQPVVLRKKHQTGT